MKRLDKELLIIQALRNDAHLNINKLMIKKIGLIPAVLLSELVSRYYYFKTKGMLNENGGFYVSQKDLKDDIGLSEFQQRNAVKALSNLIIVKLKGMPAINYYYIDFQAITNLLFSSEETSHQDVKKLDNKLSSFFTINNNNNKNNNKEGKEFSHLASSNQEMSKNINTSSIKQLNSDELEKEKKQAKKENGNVKPKRRSRPKKFPFSASVYYSDKTRIYDEFMKLNDDMRKKYGGAYLPYYIEAVNDWGDSKQFRTDDAGWFAMLKKFIKYDLEAGRLMTKARYRSIFDKSDKIDRTNTGLL